VKTTVALLALLAATGCGNYGNVYLPEGRRKPDLGPEPREFGPAADLNKTATQFRARINAPPGVPLRLTIDCGAPNGETISVWVNARSLPAGSCPYSALIPVGTIVPDTAALVEIEASGPIPARRLEVQRAQP
jgi:predicted small lipoprotein YifL